MKEAIGGISLYQIVIVLIVLFVGIMCLTINESKAFAIKDEIINTIQNGGLGSTKEPYLNSETPENISKIMKQVGYRNTGKCPNGYIGYNRDGGQVNSNASICIKAVNANDNTNTSASNVCANNACKVLNNGTAGIKMYYYEIILFYKLDVPVINLFTNFKVTGSTKVMYG